MVGKSLECPEVVLDLMKVDSQKGRPTYLMAPESPLCLVNSEYPTPFNWHMESKKDVRKGFFKITKVIDVLQPQLDSISIKLLQLKSLVKTLDEISGKKNVSLGPSSVNHVPIMKRDRCDSVDAVIKKKFRK
jgi:hypothetical protein